MKILVLGASGFIGSAFIEQALAAGHEILGISRRSGKQPVKYALGSLAQAPWREIRDFKPEACVHAAWFTNSGEYLESPLNIELKTDSLNFIAALAKEGLGHAVLLGTCIEYAISGKNLDERSSPTEPHSLYARSKCELHEELEILLSHQNSKLSWARIFYPFGVGEDPHRLPSTLIRNLRNNQELILKTPDSIKDYIHISDVASALLKIVSHKMEGTVNIGTGVGVSVEALALSIARRMGKVELVKRAKVLTDDPYYYVVANSARIRSLGWQPQVDLDSGLAQMIEG